MYKYKKTRFFKIGAARRATGTKLSFVFCFFKKTLISQGQGRPQGNGDKTDLRLYQKTTYFSILAVLLLFGLLAPGCFFGFWPPAVFKFLAPGCIYNLGPRLLRLFFVRLFLCLPCILQAGVTIPPVHPSARPSAVRPAVHSSMQKKY